MLQLWYDTLVAFSYWIQLMQLYNCKSNDWLQLWYHIQLQPNFTHQSIEYKFLSTVDKNVRAGLV